MLRGCSIWQLMETPPLFHPCQPFFCAQVVITFSVRKKNLSFCETNLDHHAHNLTHAYDEVHLLLSRKKQYKVVSFLFVWFYLTLKMVQPSWQRVQLRLWRTWRLPTEEWICSIYLIWQKRLPDSWKHLHRFPSTVTLHFFLVRACVFVSLRQLQRTMAFAGMLSDEDVKAAVQACQSESDGNTLARRHGYIV